MKSESLKNINSNNININNNINTNNIINDNINYKL